MRAGADLVLGSGPHVLRGIELYRQRLIAYSLGNLAGFHNFGLGGRTALSALLRVRVGPKARSRRERCARCGSSAPGWPAPDPSGAAARLVSTLSAEDFGRRGVRVDPQGALSLTPLPPPR